MTTLYRYYDFYTDSGVHLSLMEFDIIKETKCGCWINDYSTKGKKFVNLNAKKQFACRTKEKAFLSFRNRKHRQIQILRSQLLRAKLALELSPDEPYVRKGLRL